MIDRASPTQVSQVKAMFARIATRYDLLNRLMTLGRDRAWRREAVRRLRLEAGHLTLDIGAGTGDLAFEVLRQQPNGRVIALDFTPEMICIGQRRNDDPRLDWVIADAGHLPFPNQTFTGVISGFLLRNVPDVESALRQQARVLATGGRWAALDTTRPVNNRFRPLVEFYLTRVIPWMGQLVAGDRQSYSYLPRSTLTFLTAEELAYHARHVGLNEVSFIRRMAGSIAIHWGVRTSGKA